MSAFLLSSFFFLCFHFQFVFSVFLSIEKKKERKKERLHSKLGARFLPSSSSPMFPVQLIKARASFHVSYFFHTRTTYVRRTSKKWAKKKKKKKESVRTNGKLSFLSSSFLVCSLAIALDVYIASH